MIRWIVLLSLTFFLPQMGVCGGGPVPPEYKAWSRPGATLLDVKKVMLECGFPTPETLNSDMKIVGMTSNDCALADLCMQKVGFIRHSFFGSGSGTTCHYEPALPACQPGAIIPTPSVERRLNSWWCNPDYTFYGCVQRDDRFPERCVKYDYRKRDNLPPECLP